MANLGGCCCCAHHRKTSHNIEQCRSPQKNHAHPDIHHSNGGSSQGEDALGKGALQESINKGDGRALEGGKLGSNCHAPPLIDVPGGSPYGGDSHHHRRIHQWKGNFMWKKAHTREARYREVYTTFYCPTKYHRT